MLASLLVSALMTPAQAATVVVPVPKPPARAQLTVQGRPSMSEDGQTPFTQQVNWYEVCAFDRDEKGKPVANSERNCVRPNLNTPVTLNVGHYILKYAATYEVLQLKAGERKVVRLHKLEVPSVPATRSWEVLVDYTDTAEMNKRLFAAYISSAAGPVNADYFTATQACSVPVSEAQYWGECTEASVGWWRTATRVRDCGLFQCSERMVPVPVSTGYVLVFAGTYAVRWNYADTDRPALERAGVKIPAAK